MVAQGQGRMRGLKENAVTANKYRVSFWGDENVMQLDANDCTTLWAY